MKNTESMEERFDKFMCWAIDPTPKETLDFIRQELALARNSALDEAIGMFNALLENHCEGRFDDWTLEDCNCNKEHLYCGHELDHGIELGVVIAKLKELKK